MGRLTEQDELGNWKLKGVEWKELHEGLTFKLWNYLYGALCKLKDYENTGLDPESRNFLIFNGGRKYV